MDGRQNGQSGWTLYREGNRGNSGSGQRGNSGSGQRGNSGSGQRGNGGSGQHRNSESGQRGNSGSGQRGRGGPSGGRGNNFPSYQNQNNGNKPHRLMEEGSPIPNISQEVVPCGWTNKDVVTFKPPPSMGSGILSKRIIPVETNHIETWIRFPNRIYHYEITVKYGDRIVKSTDKFGKPSARKGGNNGDCEKNVDEIRPKLWKKLVKHVLPKIEERHVKLGGSEMSVASDYSKALYSTCELRGIDEYFRIKAKDMHDESDESTCSFIVTVTGTKSIIDTKSLSNTINNMRGKEINNIAEVEQIYNIVLKTLLIHTFIPVGRASFYSVPEDGGFGLGGGLVNIAGFSSIYTFGWKPFINIDIANSAFLLGRDVLDVIHDLFQSEFRQSNPRDVRSWGPKELQKVNELLKSCQITYGHGGNVMRKRVEEVLAKRPSDCDFQIEKMNTNVEEYFRSRGVKLQYMYGPCLYVGKNKAIIPAEICIIEKGQSYAKKLADYQTAAMIKDTAKPPAERKKRIIESIKACHLEDDKVLKEFGVGVQKFGAGLGSAKLLQFEKTRILPSPDLCYGPAGKQRIKAVDGVWNIWEHDFRFIYPIQVKRWRVLYMNTNSFPLDKAKIDLLDRFVGTFRRMCQQSAMTIPHYEGCDSMNANVDAKTLENELGLYFSKLKYEKDAFVLVAIPQKNHPCYGIIKKVAELGEVGVLTQCVAVSNIMKNQNATIGNLVLKLNAKLGGINHAIDLTVNLNLSLMDFVKYPILLLGADVTHPSANSLMPSVAAVTGSFDRYGMQYCMHPQVQQRVDKNAAEIIENFDIVVERMLKQYKEKAGRIPKKIIFFRDGVGEGQFAEVLQKEMGAIRNACRKMSQGSYQPQVTFVTVQKRHKTRFFVKNFSEGVGKSCNAPPGTIIDTEIVHPTEMDFYLLSHQGIQGTSRPTRYHLLWDDSTFSADEIQWVTYALCHAYSRCARSVSIPAPTYYAHLAAYRVRCQIEAMPSTSYTNIDELNKLVQRNAGLIENYPMHFL